MQFKKTFISAYFLGYHFRDCFRVSTYKNSSRSLQNTSPSRKHAVIYPAYVPEKYFVNSKSAIGNLFQFYHWVYFHLLIWNYHNCWIHMKIFSSRMLNKRESFNQSFSSCHVMSKRHVDLSCFINFYTESH